MDWRHWIGLALILVLGYWLGGKYPGMIAKATGGHIAG